MKPTDIDTSNEKKLSQLMDGEWQEIDPAECVAALCADTKLHAKWSRYHIVRDVLKNEPVQSDPALAARICSAIRDEPAYTNISLFSGAQATPTATTSVEGVAEKADPSATVVQAESARVERLQISSGGQTVARPNWVNTGAAGFAVAASVALVTVVGLNLVQQQEKPTAVLQSVATAPSAVPDIPVTLVNAPTANVFSGFPQTDADSLPTVEFVANTGSYWVSPESSLRVPDEKRLNMMLSHHIENAPMFGQQGLLPYSRLVGYEENTESSLGQ